MSRMLWNKPMPRLKRDYTKKYKNEGRMADKSSAFEEAREIMIEFDEEKLREIYEKDL